MDRRKFLASLLAIPVVGRAVKPLSKYILGVDSAVGPDRTAIIISKARQLGPQADPGPIVWLYYSSPTYSYEHTDLMPDFPVRRYRKDPVTGWQRIGPSMVIKDLDPKRLPG